MKISAEVLRVMGGMVVSGNAVTIPGPPLERKLYEATDKVLEALGGAWSRKAKAHVFDGDPEDALAMALATGEATTSREMGYFPTPAGLASELVALARVRRGDHVLEPSAGDGAIARALRDAGCDVECFEFDPKRAAGLRDQRFPAQAADFLMVSPELFKPFAACVMNPPFGKRADLAHVTHALRFVRPGGRLVAVMAAGLLFRQDRKTSEFHALLDWHHGVITPNADDTFKASGTSVRTVTVAMVA